MEASEDYKLEEIVNFWRGRRGQPDLYMVKWEGWDAKDNTWEPLDHVEDCREHLHAFYSKRLVERSQAKKAKKKSLPVPPRPADFREESEESEDDYEVEKILDYKDFRYLLKWRGYPDSHNSWEPEKNLGSCKELLDQFREERRVKDLPPERVQMVPQPRTIRDRLQNEEAFKAYNEGHQDDLFEDERPPFTFNLLGAVSSDSDLDLSAPYTPRTPLSAYPGLEVVRSPTPPEYAQTPQTPTGPSKVSRFQHQAYIQKKLAEKTKSDRAKFQVPADLVVSRSQMDKMVEQSTKVIGSLADQSVGRSLDPEDEPMEEWFEEDM